SSKTIAANGAAALIAGAAVALVSLYILNAFTNGHILVYGGGSEYVVDSLTFIAVSAGSWLTALLFILMGISNIICGRQCKTKDYGLGRKGTVFILSMPTGLGQDYAAIVCDEFKCPECGATFGTSLKFCSDCGHSFGTADGKDGAL
ncbi:MAG: zinc ribbon domain-containing protein, partial [Candidatus Methanoplasma sp.]|nr:zinc ribbon domain-containing protein [Candidatus Methanoplasma sp.]